MGPIHLVWGHVLVICHCVSLPGLGSCAGDMALCALPRIAVGILLGPGCKRLDDRLGHLVKAVEAWESAKKTCNDTNRPTKVDSSHGPAQPTPDPAQVRWGPAWEFGNLGSKRKISKSKSIQPKNVGKVEIRRKKTPHPVSSNLRLFVPWAGKKG